MSIAPLNTTNSNAPVASGPSGRTDLTERVGAAPSGVGSTLSSLANAAVDGVSASVSFSGKALHALEQAGEAVVDGVEDVAVGAWHAVQGTVAEAGHVGEVVVDAVEDGVRDVVSATKSAAQELGHYAAVGMQAVGEGVSELVSGTVMAASAGGKTLMTLV
jgi:hypothetical protein